jgi:TldD protein
LEDLVRLGLRAALADGIRYADVRIVAPQRYEHLAVRDGAANALTYSSRSGVGIRVRTERAWGFATSSHVDPESIRETAALAGRAAHAAELTSDDPLPVTSERGPSAGRYQSPVKTDPFDVPRETKLEMLLEAEKRLHASSVIKSGHASFQAWKEVKWFGSSEGVRYISSLIHVGAGVDATAVSAGEVQRRSGPNSFGGDYRQAGWEFIESLKLPELASRIGHEAAELVKAPKCPTGPTTIVLASNQLALQVHESVGHATELDRILAMEAGFAGTSWVREQDIGHLRYGSDLMDVVADATEEGGLGTFGWDDEGVPARRTPIVERGMLVGALTSRETAARQGFDRSGGTMRAEGFHRAPLIRMTNIDLLPGSASMDELLEGVDEGVFFDTNRSWSIDDKRLNFQFGTEIGRRIVKGELGRIVRNPIYAGMTPEFWRSMDAVGDASTWHLWGVPNCGKGQPQQVARVGHGAPAARFRNVAVRAG